MKGYTFPAKSANDIAHSDRKLEEIVRNLENVLDSDEIPRIGVEPIDTDEICAVLVKRRSEAGNLIINGNKRLVAIVTGPIQTDEYVIIGLRVNEDCKTSGSPSVRLFRRSTMFQSPQQRPESPGKLDGQRMAVDATDIAHSDGELVEIVEKIVSGENVELERAWRTMSMTHAIDASVVVAILVNKNSSAGSLIISGPLGVITLVETDPNLPYGYVIALLEREETCGLGGSTVRFFRRCGAPSTSPSIQTEFMETGH